MTQLAVLIERLGQVPEGAGTLLDNCAILATTDCSFGRQHALFEYPVLVFGGGCGSLRRGIHYRSTGNENTSKVLLTLLRTMGVQAADFGAEGGHVTDGLSAIEI